ncbi:MAG TPA: molybdopterin-dependent oxidoreductase [Marmoricola sp.]|nr:molybdopterin-dependent oxidoreductase [Marmoricola sp.]
MNRTWRILAFAGILTGIAGLVTSQATVWALQAKNGPVVAVASLVRDKTPGRVAHWLVEHVGHADKPLLLTGTTVFVLLVCAWVGTSALKYPLLSDIVYVVLAVIGLLAVIRLHDSTAGSAFGVLVGLITWIVVHRALTGLLAGSGTETTDAVRRMFLRRAGAVAFLVAGAGVLGGLSSRGRRRVEQARRLLRLPGGPGSVPVGANLGAPDIAPWRTPNNDFYLIDTAFTKPTIVPSEWRLRIHGLVDTPITLTYDDLVSRAFVHEWITLCCVSNKVGGDLVGNAFWSGVLIRDVLAEVGIQAGADAVLQTSHDGWTCGTPLSALTDPDRNAMLALAMNGRPLPVEHGFPVRMVVPGLYGYVSATKWLTDLEVTTFDTFQAYWTQEGWSEKGPIKTESRIDVPGSHGHTAVGTVSVGGVAWAQHTGIDHVEFQLDGGSWQRATLGTVPGNDTWVQWAGQVDVAEGDHTLVVRATDKSGYTQTAVKTDVLPNGATGWHTVPFSAH